MYKSCSELPEDDMFSTSLHVFLDIRGPDYPKPYFETKVKVRWDDERLYVGARMQETHFWGSFTEDESLGMWTTFIPLSPHFNALCLDKL